MHELDVSDEVEPLRETETTPRGFCRQRSWVRFPLPTF